MTPDTLARIMPYAGARAVTYAPHLTAGMERFKISTPRRQAAFLAQVAHESGELQFVLELASGDAYEGRRDLGNVEPGDGRRFRGRGLLQITGRRNYWRAGNALLIPATSSPAILEEPQWAAMSACWFWEVHGLSQLADDDRFFAITRAINGGYNGGDQRLKFFLRARSVLGVGG